MEGAAEQLRGFFGVERGQQGGQDLPVPELLRGEVDAQVLVVERRGVWMALKQVALVVEQFEKTPAGPPVHQWQGQHLHTGGGRIERGLMLHLPDQVANPLVLIEPQRTIAQPLRQRQVLHRQLLQARQGRAGDGGDILQMPGREGGETGVQPPQDIVRAVPFIRSLERELPAALVVVGQGRSIGRIPLRMPGPPAPGAGVKDNRIQRAVDIHVGLAIELVDPTGTGHSAFKRDGMTIRLGTTAP